MTTESNSNIPQKVNVRDLIKKEYARCVVDPQYFMNRYVKIQHPIRGSLPFELYPYQSNCVNIFRKKQYSIVLKARQTGLSTLVAAYALWLMLFHDNKSVIVVATKQDTAKNLVLKVKYAFNNLPVWLRRPLTEDNKLSIRFSNGSSIVAEASSDDATRSNAASLLILDEAAFIRDAEKIWTAAQSTLSTGGSAILISCVTPDTMIFTNNGPQRIDTIVPYEVGGHRVDAYSVLGKESIRTGEYVLNSGKTETKKVTMSHAYLEGANRHKVWTFSDGQYQWMRLDELSINDHVAIQYGMELWGSDDDVSDFVPSRTGRKTFSPQTITPDLAYFLGLFLAEGSCSIYDGYRSKVAITCGDDVSTALNALGLKYYIHPDGIHYSIGSIVELVQFLEYLGFDLKLKAPKKVIPGRLMRMSRANIIAMLQGIFDGDGFSRKDRGTVGIGLASLEMIQQIRTLLNNFGILCEYKKYISKPTKKVAVFSTQHRLLMSAVRDSQVFYDKIGFRFARKQVNASVLANYNTTRANPKDYIPSGVSLAHEMFASYEGTVASLRHEHGLVLNGVLNARGGYKTENMARDNAVQLLDIVEDRLSDERKEFFHNTIDPHIRWSLVTNIETGFDVVMDVSLPDNSDDFWCHSVIYNGVLGHQTPNGVGNFFYKKYIEAEEYKDRNKDGVFYPIKLTWRDHPERDQAWADKQLASQGERDFQQEHEAEFLGSGNTVIDIDIIQFYQKTYVREPILKGGPGGDYWVWEQPNYTRPYIVVADVARGENSDEGDFSAFHVIDVNDSRQVAEYKGRLSTTDYGNFLVSVATEYNDALLVIENGGIGWATVQTVINRGYKNLFYMTEDLKYFNPDELQSNKLYKHDKKSIAGFTTSRRTRPLIISKLEAYMRDGFYIKNEELERAHSGITIHSQRFIDELLTFIWQNGKPEAADGFNDDLIMAMSIGLWIRDTALQLHQRGIEMTKLTLNNMSKAGAYDGVYTNLQNKPDPYILNFGGGGTRASDSEDLRWLL